MPGSDEQPRSFGAGHTIALIVASMIGSGVFTTSGYALGDLGSREAVVLAWVVGAVHAMLGAISYGWLASLHPESGGEYVLLERTVHPSAGYVAGWVSVLAGFTAPIAAAAHGLEAYLGREGALWIGATAIIGSVLLHGSRRDLGAKMQTVAVALKVMLLLGFLGFGAFYITAPSQPTELASTNWAKFGPTLVWVSFSYSGWNAAVYLAGELEERTTRGLARVSALAVLLVGALYVGLNALFVYASPVADLAGKAQVGVIAAEAIGGESWATALSLIVALAMATSVSSMMMAGPRVMWKMAREGALPSFIGSGEGTPRVAIAAQGALALVVFLTSSLSELLGYIGLTLSLSAALAVFGLLLENLRGARVPEKRFMLAVPILFIISTLAMAAWLASYKPWQALASVATIAVGLVVWVLQHAWRTRRAPR